MKKFVLLASIMCVMACEARTAAEAIDEVIDVFSNWDVPPDDGAPFPVLVYSNRISRIKQELGLGDAAFSHELGVYLTNCALSARADNAFDENALRFSTLSMVLCEYAPGEFVDKYCYIMTNSTAPSVVRAASFMCARTARLTCAAMEVYRSKEVSLLSVERKANAFGGLYSATWDVRGDSDVTNRVISIALDIIGDSWGFWGQTDEELCRLWPAYATSSNRYLSVCAALASPNPPATTNYLQKVLRNLKALPPSAMVLLPTDQFESAWH